MKSVERLEPRATSGSKLQSAMSQLFPVLLGEHLAKHSARLYDCGLNLAQHHQRSPRHATNGLAVGRGSAADAAGHASGEARFDFCVTTEHNAKVYVFWVQEAHVLAGIEHAVRAFRAEIAEPVAAQGLKPAQVVLLVTRQQGALDVFFALECLCLEHDFRCFAVTAELKSVVSKLQWLQRCGAGQRKPRPTANINDELAKTCASIPQVGTLTAKGKLLPRTRNIRGLVQVAQPGHRNHDAFLRDLPELRHATSFFFTGEPV